MKIPPLLGIYPKKTTVQKDPCTPVFTAALFTKVKTWKQPKCLSTEEWLKKMWYIYIMEYSVQFSRSIVFDSLRPHELQHTRPPYSSPTPGAYSNSCPSSQSCHPTFLSSVVPLSSCLQYFPVSGCFPVSQSFSNTLANWSFSFSISPSSEYSGLTSLISLQSKGLSRVFSNTTIQKHQFFGTQLSL